MIIRILVALSFGLLMTEAATAAPLVTAMFGAGFAATLPGALLSFGLSLAGSYAMNYLFGSRGSAANDNRDPAQTTYGERQAFQGVIGRAVLGGHKVHYNEYDDAKFAQHVFVLADHMCDGLESIYVDGRQRDLLPVAGPYLNNEQARYQVAEYGALIDIRFHDGRPGQLADTELVNRTPGWDSSKKFTGQCYVVVTLQSDKEKFNGEPSFKFVLRGAKLYDPRKDSTVGGAGALRFDDPMTWQYGTNPAVAANHFARGFRLNGLRRLGADLTTADLDFSGLITAMNICDEQVQRPDSSWRNRYEGHLVWSDEDDPYAVIDRLCDTMGGVRGELQGRVTVFAGKAKVPVLTITDGDLPDDAPVKFSPKRSGAFLYSGVQGTYTHSTEFTAKAYAALEPASFVAEDGRSRLQRVDLPAVQDAHQAYLLVKQQLFRSRLQATAQITLDIKDLQLEVGDWIVWESEHPLRGTKPYEITASEIDWDAARIMLDLQEVSADAFADDATAEQVAEPARDRPFYGYQKDVFGFGVEAVALSGSGGENLPALKFTYNPITDPAIRGLKVEYRIQGDPNPTLFKATDTSAGDGEFYSSDGVMPGLTYEARAILDAVPGREANWTNWVPIAVPTGPMQVLSPESIDFGHLAKDLSNTVGVLNATGAGSLQATLDYIINELERFASEVTGEHVHAHVQRQLLQAKVGTALSQILTESTLRADGDAALADLLTVVSSQVDDVTAAILLEQTARANADGALATSLNDTIAAMGDSFAQGLFKIDAVATAGGAEATMKMMVRAASNDGWIESGILLVAKDDGTSQIALVAEETVIVNSNGELLGLFGSDGLINSAFIPNLTVNELSAISANMGTVTAGKIQSADGKLVIDLDNNKLTLSD